VLGLVLGGAGKGLEPSGVAQVRVPPDGSTGRDQPT
jgi:hypothetical protein